jgi:hypothetical protein
MRLAEWSLEIALRFFLCSVVLDALALFAHVDWAGEASFWVLAVGLVAGFMGAPCGIVPTPFRWSEARKMGREALELGALGLFFASWIVRRASPAEPSLWALALSGLGFLALVQSGWLGGRHRYYSSRMRTVLTPSST